jgi:hypothetical protein
MDSYKQEIAKLLKSARRQGWEVRTKHGHHYVWSPSGRKFTLPGTPSNQGGVWMSKKKLAKAGLELERTGAR